MASTPSSPPSAPPSEETDSGETDETEDKQGEETSEPSASGGIQQTLRESYLTLDRRLLGVFRIYFGFLLLGDVLRRLPDSTFFYSNDGVLSNHFSLFSPMIKPYFSLYTAFSTPNEVKLAFLLTALVYCFYIVGYRTRLAQVAAFVLFTSLNARNHFLENGGCIMVGLLCCWTMFLPLGDRFSVDAVLRSLRARKDHTVAALNDREGITPDRTPHLSLVMLAILFQISVCYFFNAVHKQGETWKSGEAVHWVLWQNRIATHLGGWFRLHEPSWFSPLMTRVTLLIEGIAPLLVFFPFWIRRLRPFHFALTTVFHLGLAAMLTLGPFSYVMIALNMLVLPGSVFDEAARRLRQGKTRRTVVYDPTDAGLHTVARILARLDHFQLLTFVDGGDTERLPSRPPKATIAVLDETTAEWFLGTAAITEASRSLPLGGLLGPLLGNALGQAILRAILRRRSRLSASLGLEGGQKAPHEGLAHEPEAEPTPLQEHVAMTAMALRESMVAVLLVAAVFQASHDNWWLPRSLRFDVPRALQPLTLYPRLIQGWSMFSPDAPRNDGTLVIDGVTSDGRHIDPLTAQAPDFEAPLHGPWYYDQFWCDYLLKITFDGNRVYRDELKRYLLDWHRIARRPSKDRIVSFDAYWVSNDSPPPGSTQITNIQKKLILSSR